jgi:TfoX/Sxy family transcriptional regulator of competence genes
MFGEYALYIDGKVVAFACDDSLFVKPASATTALVTDLPKGPPYPGAKLYPVADELLDDPERLLQLLLATWEAVPARTARQ